MHADALIVYWCWSLQSLGSRPSSLFVWLICLLTPHVLLRVSWAYWVSQTRALCPRSLFTLPIFPRLTVLRFLLSKLIIFGSTFITWRLCIHNNNSRKFILNSFGLMTIYRQYYLYDKSLANLVSFHKIFLTSLVRMLLKLFSFICWMCLLDLSVII